MFITFAIIIIRTLITTSQEYTKKHNDKKVRMQQMHKLSMGKLKMFHMKHQKEVVKNA
ncbi:hypothetical protein J6W32_03195 [bacterium]|nr:hypothetical protein [bacterium]